MSFNYLLFFVFIVIYLLSDTISPLNIMKGYQICSHDNPIDSIQIPVPIDCSSLESEKIYYTKTTIIKILPNGGCQSYIMPVYFSKKFVYIQGLSHPFFKRINRFPIQENSCVPSTAEPIGGDYFIRDPDQFSYSIEYECTVCYQYFIKGVCEDYNEMAFLALKIMEEKEDNIEVKLARLLTKRTDVTGKVSGLSIKIMECSLYKPDKVFSNRTIGNICYKEIPVKIGNNVFFTLNNLDLLKKGTEISCFTILNFHVIWAILLTSIIFIILIPGIYHLIGTITKILLFIQENMISKAYNLEVQTYYLLVKLELKLLNKLNLKKGWFGLGSFLSLLSCKTYQNIDEYEAEIIANLAIKFMENERKKEMNIVMEEGMLARSKQIFENTNTTEISDKSIIYEL
uniref:Glycoprotein n=1 Tax=Parastrongyloides trichosuri TaxID=131310 RepID=A0A0N4Z4D1_PARTI